MINKVIDRLTRAAMRGSSNVMKKLDINEPLVQVYENMDENDFRVLEKMVGRDAVIDFVKKAEMHRMLGGRSVSVLNREVGNGD